MSFSSPWYTFPSVITAQYWASCARLSHFPYIFQKKIVRRFAPTCLHAKWTFSSPCPYLDLGRTHYCLRSPGTPPRLRSRLQIRSVTAKQCKNPGIWPKIQEFGQKIQEFGQKKLAGAKKKTIFGLLLHTKHSIFCQNLSRPASCPNFLSGETQGPEG